MKLRSSVARGFTLVEVVVTIILSALAMAAVLPFLGEVFMRSYEPRIQLSQALGLQSAMEDMVALHTNRLAELKQVVGSEGGRWEEAYTVVENRYVHFVSGQEASGPPTNSLLKITLRNPLGEWMTRLFAEPL